MYNPAKAAHIIAYLALKTPGRTINMLKAIKLVYIADRESLRRFAIPMLDEPRFSLPKGPANSLTCEHARGETVSHGWSAVLDDRADHMIGVKKGIVVDDLDELSDAEIETLDQVWAKFGAMDQWALVDWTHNSKNLPEWEDPGLSSTPIPLERILLALGFEDPAEHAQFLRDRSDISTLIAELA
jgi:uncharacterized phage-associated protein